MDLDRTHDRLIFEYAVRISRHVLQAISVRTINYDKGMSGGTKRLISSREDINIISIAELLAFENVTNCCAIYVRRCPERRERARAYKSQCRKLRAC